MRLPTPIPIHITPYFWLMAGMLGFMWTQAFVPTLLIMVIVTYSVLAHELGHALTARYFGQRSSITLVFFGGVTERRGGKLALWKEFFITLNGPLAGLTLALVAGTLLRHPLLKEGVFGQVLAITMLINVFWSIVNLLPVLPLDGGRLMSILLEGAFGVTGVRLSLLFSVLLGAGMGVVGMMLGQMILGAIFFLLAFESFRGWRQSLQFEQHDQDRELQQRLSLAEETFDRRDYELAEGLLVEIREQTKKGMIHLRATHLLAQLYAKTHRYAEALELLQPLAKKLQGPDLELLHSVAFECGEWKLVAEVGSKLHQEVGGAEVALHNAIAHGVLNEPEAAVGWFRAALRDGLSNPATELLRQEFNSIRSDKRFQKLDEELRK